MASIKTIPIFFSCDDAYIPFLSVSLTSMMESASESFLYYVRILHSRTISKHNQDKISSSHRHKNLIIEFVDITTYVVKISDKLHTRDYYSKSTYYRLFIPNLYPQYDKVLYLDSDIVICGDISALFNTDLGDNLVGAIPDGAILKVKVFQDYAEQRVGVEKYHHYFNAGILLMNTKRLREIDFETLFIDMLGKVTFDVAQDQDYLNAICKGKVTYIDETWNQMPINSKDGGSGRPNLIHFNLSFKPWHADDVPYGQHFWHYAKKSPYHQEIIDIKANYSSKAQEASHNETIHLMSKANSQALATEENERIQAALKAIQSQIK